MAIEVPNDIRCDVLIFVATSSERDGLQSVAERMSIPFRRQKSLGYSYYSMGQIGQYRVNAVRTEMGPFSHEGSAAKGLLFRAVSGATAIIQIGMAFGVNDRAQKIGDVLVSSYLYPYDYRTVTTRDWNYNVDYSRVVPHPANSSLLEMCRRHLTTPREYNVFVGGLLTGGARIFSRYFLHEIDRSLPRVDDGVIVGGEMEGAGLLSTSPPKDACWIVVKGVCDFADEQRDRVIQEARPVACQNSANFVLSALASSPTIPE